MIYGIVASEFHLALPPPIQALGSFDFANGIYDWQGTSLTAAQVIDQTDWIGVGGLAIPASGASGANILYSAATTVLATCSWTIVIEVDLATTPASPHWCYFLVITEVGETYMIQIGYCSGWQANAYGSAATFAGDFTNSLTTGIHKFAVTRTNAKTVVSVDGNAIQSDTTPCTLPNVGSPMTDFLLGGWPEYTDEAFKVRSLAIYDVQDDVDLPSLSA